MNVQDIRLDIDKKTGVSQWVTIGQGDKGGTTIRATVFDNGVAAALTGMSARFELRMPNATYFEDTNCTVSGNVITYVVDESHAALYAGGSNEAYFALYDGETAIYSTERFHVRVLRSARDGTAPAESWSSVIDELVQRGEEAVADTEQAVTSANNAVSAANAAVTNANTAVTSANAAAEGANQAAASAGTAASAANAAAADARSATGAANTAAASANQAAGAANTAKASADTAASNANAKATLANSAATAANTAKANADAATASANAAAQDALDAAEAARGAVSENLRFVIGVREYHDGTQRIVLIDHGEE